MTLLNNGRYNIVSGEYKGVGASAGPAAIRMLDLRDPDLNWVKPAKGMGAEARALQAWISAQIS
jgi:acetolactate synthase-1/2/3 large subunit